MKFKFHLPNWVEGDPEREIEVRDLQELLALGRVRNFINKDFSHFSQTDQGHTLMAENEKSYWVVGVSNIPLDLPEWHPRG